MFKRLLRQPARPSPSVPPAAEQATHPSIVGDDGFADVLRASPVLTLVDFWAEWCQPCEVMSYWVEELAREFGGSLRVLALDVDQNPKTPEGLGVMGLPTLIFFRDGVEVQRTLGVTTYADLKRQVEKLIAISNK